MSYEREVRLGIVLYGGVSLAVYENGVAQELYRAIRGDGVYGLIKELIGSDIVVDVISGTSAGGVNGVMLAYALANQLDFRPSADLWRDEADIQELLRSEHDPTATSILNSAYYQDKLEECFAKNLKPAANPPDVDELDLFVTGTDANGDITTVFDDQGHPIDVKSHRALFKLAYRKNRPKVKPKNDLDPKNAADLATLARLTSCFPVAFEPVRIGDEDKNFFRWGKLRNPGVFLDGGILNNKPFTSTIDAIASRTANREVNRFLIYVEPDPESFERSPAAVQNPPSPNVAQAAASSLLGIPQYQSIAADLTAIQAHNERAQRIAEIFDALPPAAQTEPDCLTGAAVLPEDLSSYENRAYYKARFIQLRDTAIKGILNNKDGRPYFSAATDRRSGRILVESFNQWRRPPDATLTDFDVFFRMRRVTYLSRILMRRVQSGKAVPSALWDVVNHYFKLYEIVEWALVSWLDAWQYPWQDLGVKYSSPDVATLEVISDEVWGAVRDRLVALLYSNVPVPPAATPEARAAFYTDLSDRLREGAPQAAQPPRNLLAALDDSFKQWLRALPADDVSVLLRNEFCRFIDVDRQIFPIQLGSDFESTDTVRVVRFSPKDAQRGFSNAAVKQKVCGIALGAFGGFFKKSWRASDIMMGRFDAACLLLECLLTPERLAAMGPQAARSVQDLAKYLPHADAEFAKVLNSYLAAPAQASADQWGSMLDKIVEAYHAQIYAEEWPNVQRCALEQEYAWSRYRQQSKKPHAAYHPKHLTWVAGKSRPDQVLVATAAHAISLGELPAFQPGLAAGDGFLDEIPDTILQELGFLAAIRASKSLVQSVPNENDQRTRIRGSKFYYWPFAFVLPLLYRWARMRRTQPDSVIIFNTAIPAACLAAMIAAIALKITGTLTWETLAWPLLVPLLLLLVWALWFRR